MVSTCFQQLLVTTGQYLQCFKELSPTSSFGKHILHLIILAPWQKPCVLSISVLYHLPVVPGDLGILYTTYSPFWKHPFRGHKWAGLHKDVSRVTVPPSFTWWLLGVLLDDLKSVSWRNPERGCVGKQCVPAPTGLTRLASMNNGDRAALNEMSWIFHSATQLPAPIASFTKIRA